MMRISNKAHRGTSMAAAVIMLIVLFISTCRSLLSAITSAVQYNQINLLLSQLLSLAMTLAVALPVIVSLFRGKKDTAAGALFIISALLVLVNGVYSFISIMVVYRSLGITMAENVRNGMTAASVLNLFAALVSVALRVSIAVECFKPGSFSGSQKKAVLLLLPIANVVLIMATSIVQQLYIAEYGIGRFVLSVILPAVIVAVTNVGTILMGLAFSIPVYETVPAETAVE